MDEETYLKDRLGDQIRWYDSKSVQCQKKFKYHRIFQIVIAALLPVAAIVVAILNCECINAWFPAVAGIWGAAVTISVSISALCKYQENWLEYRTTTETLKHEKNLYLAKAGPYSGENAFQLLVERVERLISTENSKWQAHQQSIK